MTDRPGLAPFFERMSAQHPDGIVVVSLAGDVVWANAASEWREGARLADRLDASVVASWQLACEDAVTAARELERELPQPHGPPRRVRIAPIGPNLVALHVLPIPARPHESEFQLLFSQNVHAVFFTRLDQPFHWPTSIAEQDALLDYAFDHLRVTAVNDVLCRHMNRTREQLLGTTPGARWERAKWCEHMRRLYNQGHAFHSLRAPLDNGTWLDVEGEYVCTYDNEGRITGHCGIQRDISEKLEVVAELAKSRERLELAIMAADIGVWDADLTTQRVHFEPRWMARFGYGDTDNWRAWDWWASVLHPDDVEPTRRAFQDHARGLVPIVRVEYRMRTASGAWVWLLSIGKQEKDSQRVVGIAVDITERKALQARVIASERLAALGTLAAGVGHEINNPLTYVVLNLQMVARRLADPSASASELASLTTLIDGALYGAQRVATIVRDLQMLARPIDDRSAAADPIASIERALGIADHQIRHRAHIIRELAATPNVRCSEDRLIQVLLNLLVNAAQAMPDGEADRRWIRIATSTTSAGQVAIDIWDNGRGIAFEVLDRIFDPFFTTKGIGEGIGLGLSICRTIVTSFGGDIEVASDPHHGTRFRVLLPCEEASGDAPAPVVAATPAAPPESPAMLPGIRRILVVDDEPMLGELLKSVLHGIDVEVESTTLGALGRLSAGESFDRILCDIMMPELTGMDLYERVAEHLRSQIVFMTGGAFTERARAFLARVPNRRLMKPFDAAQLATALAD